MDIEMPKSPADFGKLKEEIDAALAGRLEGLDIDTPSHWGIAPVNDPVQFFTGLDAIMPANSILYFEGTNVSPAAQAYYAAHRAKNAVPVARDTIFPVPETFHINYSPEVVAGLLQLFAAHEQSDLCNHIKGYASGALIFVLHDGFGNVLRLSQRVPESAVKTFSDRLSVEYKQCRTTPRDMRQLELFRRMLENDYQREKVFDYMRSGQAAPATIRNKPWWGRFWDKLRGE